MEGKLLTRKTERRVKNDEADEQLGARNETRTIDNSSQLVCAEKSWEMREGMKRRSK